MKTNFNFWQKWLLTVCLFILLFGMGMVFTSGTPIFEIFHRQIDPAFWPASQSEQINRQFQGWIYGVWGATLAGWGVFLSFLAAFPFRAREKWAWNCMVVGLMVWFILDTGISIVYAVWFNVFINSTLFILAGLPILVTRKDIFGRRSQ